VTEKEIAKLLVHNALATQRADPEDYTEANGDPSLKALGNATIANSLERLGGHGIVADVQPTLGEHGMGFVYRISPNLIDELSSEELVVGLVNGLFDGPRSETSSTLAALLDNCERVAINQVYRDDLLASIKELRICFSQECYIACLSLAGKILEISLKQVLIDNNIEFGDKLMIGQLIGKFQEAHLDQYLDQSLSDIANIINKSRIPAVHSKEKIPVPSRDQAAMVIHAVVDTVNRVIVSPGR
jgi:hypothetical protein